MRLFDILETITPAIKSGLEPNHDGYGANPVSEYSCKQAMDFLFHYSDIPIPSFGCEPSGEMGMEWICGSNAIAACFPCDKRNSTAVYAKITDKQAMSGLVTSYFLAKFVNDLYKTGV